MNKAEVDHVTRVILDPNQRGMMYLWIKSDKRYIDIPYDIPYDSF